MSFSSGVYDRDDDLSLSKGSAYTTSKGGGLIELVADSVTVNGQITANAVNAGGSGGGVLIAANTLSGNGVIQTSGAAASPVGGNGRVKLLRGVTSPSFSGTVVGNTRTSPMPPIDMVSGSHPDSSKWYNDGLGDWYLAWTKPFASSTGYYVKSTTDVSVVPAASNATFHQMESIVVPATSLVAGTNYFHITSVDSMFTVGTVKATASVNINMTPPTVTSPSHPSSSTWYANSAIALAWTNPQADSNYTGYYFLLDNFADTVPPAIAANFTTNKQIIKANTPDGIWYFHVVNRDTRNATTRAAFHYRVNVGAEPAKQNLSGSVFDGSNNNAPLSGATVSINRGVFSQSSAANGTYTFGGNLYVGSWEVTVSKAGYQTVRQMVAVTAGSAVNANFTLVH
jgi:hypothetical protein